ncbi:MAG: anti-sigma factor family protein [Parcubacteria group bacterium]
MSITDEMLMAYVDGELPEAERLKVESVVAADPALQERLEKHRRFRTRMGGAFAGVLDEPVPERLLESAKPSNVVPFPIRRRAVPGWAAIAATLVVGVVAGLSVPRGPQPMIGSDLRAHGALATALDKQLASSPARGAIVRVGLSFRSADGYCRTFTERFVAGLACREGSGWKVRMAVAQETATTGDYRTAASETPPQVLEAAQALMVGDPLDARAEVEAQQAGWK